MSSTTQQSISLQAGRSLQRIASNPPCPCTTVTNTRYQSRNLSRKAFVNLTMLQQEFIQCVLSRTNFTKSTLALFSIKGCQGESTTFTQVSMSDGCLSNCCFPHALWNGAWLHHIQLSNMKLSHNIFSNSNMNFVVFQDADMKRCVFDSSSIRNCRFQRIRAVEDLPLLDDPLLLDDLIHRTHHHHRVSFNAASLDSCAFEEAHLAHVQGVGSQFNDCEMVNCRLRRGNFEHATFRDCSFNHCGIQKSDFLHANISECTFHDVDCSGANFSLSTLHAIDIDADTRLTNILCTHAQLTDNFWTDHDYGEEAFFDHASMMNCRFNRSTMIHANFCAATMENVRFNRVIFSVDASFSANFAEATFNNVSFHHAQGAHVSFYKTKWSNNCSLRDATLDHTDFTEATLLDCNLNNVNCDHAKFRKATLTQCSMNNASLNHVDFTSSILTNIETNALTQLLDVTFTDAKLYSSTWTDIDDFGASRFDSAELFQCQFDHSNMSRVNFCSTKLAEVSLKATILGQDANNFADFTEATLNTIATDAETVFDYCTFSKAHWSNTTLDHVSMVNCDFNYATLDHVEYVGVDLTESTFHHATLIDVTIDATTILAGVSFIDSEMDTVQFPGTLDNVVFDGSKLFNVNFSGASLIAASFVGATLSDTDFTDAILSEDYTEGLAEDANVVTKFEQASLTRVTFGGTDSLLRFTIFSESTLTLCEFRGTSYYNMLNLSEANFDSTIVSDCEFSYCNLSNATFANSTLIRCHFTDCAMSDMDTENVELQYCTADEQTVLPANWMRDSNGWIVLLEPGPLPAEEARHEILTLGAFGTSFRPIQRINHKLDSGVYVVTWNDGSVGDATRLHKMSMVQPEQYEIDDAVFVCVRYDTESNDNNYLHGKIVDTHLDGTYDIAYYVTSALVQYETAPTRQNHVDIFPEYFEDGEEATVAIFDNQYYRLVQQINETLDDTTINVTWFDNTASNATDPLQILLKQPITVSVNTAVMVYVMSSDRYYPGVVYTDNGNNTYEIQYAYSPELPSGGGSTPTRQHIEFLYLQIVPESEVAIVPDEPVIEPINSILLVGLFGNKYRAIKTLGSRIPINYMSNSSYNVTWFDDTIQNALNIQRLDTNNQSSLNKGDSVFVSIDAMNDNYLPGIIDKVYSTNSTYDILYRGDFVNLATAPVNQPASKVFLQYFAFGTFLNVGIYENKYFRSIKDVLSVNADGSLEVEWYDNTTGTATNPLQLSCVPPLYVDVDDVVFVMIENDVVTNDNHYVLGTVGSRQTGSNYSIVYSNESMIVNPENKGRVPTLQNIIRIFSLKQQ